MSSRKTQNFNERFRNIILVKFHENDSPGNLRKIVGDVCSIFVFLPYRYLLMTCEMLRRHFLYMNFASSCGSANLRAQYFKVRLSHPVNK